MDNKAKKVDWRTFNYKTKSFIELDPARRVCVFLLWGAKTYPYTYCSLQHMTRISLVQDALPREDGKDMIEFKRRYLDRVRALAFTEHNAALLSDPGFGYRFTVDDYDKLMNAYTKKIKAVDSRFHSAEALLASIDRSKLPPAAQKFYDECVSGTKKLKSNFDKLPQLPSSTEKKDEKEKEKK